MSACVSGANALVGYSDYSDTRPDLVIHRPEGLTIGDTKVVDPLGSEPGKVGVRGAHVGFGNTLPGVQTMVCGLEQRGRSLEADSCFRPATGGGFVAPVCGAYHRPVHEHGAEALVLLFETFGGFGPHVTELIWRAAEARGNKLRGSEYDDTTWSARTWASYACQRLSCALMRAVAWEMAVEMRLTRVRDTRDDD